jgi:hypothetical protein
MRRLLILSVVGAAALCGSLAVVASAMASEPAVYECAKLKKEAGKFHGKYNNLTCSSENTKDEGEFELKEGVGKGKTFKGSGGKAELHTPKILGVIECKAFKDEGKILTPKSEGKIVATFSGCETLGKKCTSTGEKAGFIKTSDLAGGIGYIDAEEHRVGADLSAESGTQLANFSCEGLTVVVEGSVIGEIKPVNTFTKTMTDAFEINASGFQKYKKLEGMPEDVLEATVEGAGPYESGQECSAVNKGEELELKA